MNKYNPPDLILDAVFNNSKYKKNIDEAVEKYDKKWNYGKSSIRKRTCN